MIKAVIFRDAQESLVGFDISGHAGYAERGQDIVCAAVSFLATTTVNSLNEQLKVSPHYEVDEAVGHLHCCLVLEKMDRGDLEKAQVILKTLEIGLKSLEQDYGKYIKLQQRRWTKC
ncbi:MAG: ribosomal-processing cysteine protease Prp [Clostridia bacterium]|nr:ribosomal-processing cysteine protease Prp [Clostridia bacterium]